MKLVDALPYDEWLRWRELGLGGSDADCIMGTSKFKSPEKLWEERTGRCEAQEQNPAMARGLALEPEARAEYERITGIPMPKQLGIHDTHHWLRASFDGINFEAERAIEIKCPGEADHRTACAGKIPGHYLWQLVHLLLVSDLPVIDYVSYDKRTTAIVPFERNLTLESRLIKRELAFWNCIENDVSPVAGSIAQTLSDVFKVRRNRARKR